MLGTSSLNNKGIKDNKHNKNNKNKSLLNDQLLIVVKMAGLTIKNTKNKDNRRKIRVLL